MKKNEEKSLAAQNEGLRLQNLRRTVTVSKESHAEQDLAARDDTRLSLHVMHGTVSLH